MVAAQVGEAGAVVGPHQARLVGEDDGVDADTGERAARHILNDLGLVVRRAGDEVHGSAEVVPEMCVPGTGHLRTSILAVRVEVRDAGGDPRPAVTATPRASTWGENT